MGKKCFTVALFLTAIVVTIAGCATSPAAPDRTLAMQKAASEDPGKIVAVKVDGSAITMDALVKMMNRLGPPPEAGSAESLEAVKKSALDRLILQELAYQQAKKQGIRIEQKKIDTAIANFKENAGGEQEYMAFLKKEGKTETDLRADVERSLLLEHIYNREVLEKTFVPDDVLLQEYERDKMRFVIPEKLAVTDVFFVKGDRKTLMKKAKDIRKKITADPGRDPWKLVLDGTFIVRAMDLNREKQPELYRAAKKLKPGELSGIVAAPDGLHILSVKSASPEHQLSFDEVKKTLESKFRVAAQQKRLQEWGAELKKTAVIEINEQALQSAEKPKDGDVRNK